MKKPDFALFMLLVVLLDIGLNSDELLRPLFVGIAYHLGFPLYFSLLDTSEALQPSMFQEPRLYAFFCPFCRHNGGMIFVLLSDLDLNSLVDVFNQ